MTHKKTPSPSPSKESVCADLDGMLFNTPYDDAREILRAAIDLISNPPVEDTAPPFSALRELKDEFEDLAKPLIKFMNDNPQAFNPHHYITITNNSAEISSGVMMLVTNEFVKD